jgi:hypothetical protein
MTGEAAMRAIMMSIGLVGVLASGAMAQASAPAQPATRPPMTGCSVFDPVDIAKLPKALPPQLPVITDALAKRLGDWKSSPQADADIVVDSTDPMSGRRTTVLAERIGGVWRVSAVQDGGHAQGGSAAAPASKQATLDAEHTAALSQVLDDACFWSTPPILPNEVPAKDGGVFECRDGMNTTFRVRAGSRLWYGEQDCRLLGLPGRIGQILWSASLAATFSGAYHGYQPPPGAPARH